MMRISQAAKGARMMTIPNETRGLADHGWLKSRHTFSFADYYDPKRMGFGALRVINDDQVAAAMGFGTHPHRDMEIISIPLSGSLQHRDSEGNAAKIRKGEVQIMSAGTGIFHSEYNASDSEEVRFLQIWVMPKKYGIKPRYDQKTYELKDNELTLVVSPEGTGTAVGINQDAYFSLGRLTHGTRMNYEVKREGNGVFVFVLAGSLTVNGMELGTRDGVGISETNKLDIHATSGAEVLLMEVPMMGTHG
jgi:redox-sensitive bicupin YhaK (pirin superfamily)